MTALEQEIIEKFNQLDTEARQRVFTYIQNIALAPSEPSEWWQDIEAIQSQMRARLGKDETTGMLDLLC
jgi:hypothetical protein